MLAVLFISGVSGKTIRITPQWYPQAQFAGLYIAEKKGFFKDMGVDVQIVHPSGTESSLDMLRDGKTDIAMSQLIDALTNYDSGFELLNILQTSERNSVLIVTREPLDSIQQLSGKRVGHWKSGFSEGAFIMNAELGLNLRWIPYNSDVSIFLSGVLDATLTMIYNEYDQILMSGVELTEKNVFPLSDYIVDAQEDGFYTTPEFYNNNIDDVWKCVTAIKEAWEWARIKSHRKEAVEIVMSMLKDFNLRSNITHQRYMLDKILENQETKDGVVPYMVDPVRFNELVSLMRRYGFIFNEVDYNDMVITLEK